MIRNEYGNQINAGQMRAIIGLPKKLPPWGAGPWVIQGHMVKLLSRRQAQERSPGAIKPHRIMVQCNHCAAWVPFGRQQQHKCRDRDYLPDAHAVELLRIMNDRGFVSLGCRNVAIAFRDWLLGVESVSARIDRGQVGTVWMWIVRRGR